VVALVFESKGQHDDDILAFSQASGGLGEGSVWLAQVLQPWDMDRSGGLPASCVRVDQRREQLHQRQKADEGDAGGLLHKGWGSSGWGGILPGLKV